jgi:hypothetical protein
LEKEPAVWIVDLAEQAAELLEIVGILDGAAPEGFVARLPRAKVACFGRLGAVVRSGR